MSSPFTLASRAIRQTLYTESAELNNLVGDRTFMEDADEDEEYPFVVIQHITGGDDNDAQSRACDMLYKVVGHTNNKDTARQLSDAIHDGLHRRMPDVTGINTEALPYTWIEEIEPVTDREVKQAVTFYQFGGLYRIRLSLEAIV